MLKSIHQKALRYIVLMFLGDLVVKQILIWIGMTDWNGMKSIIDTLINMGLALGLGSMIESLRFIIRKIFIKKMSNHKKKIQAFWFEVIESAFACWILFSVAMIAVTYYNYRLRY